MWKNIDKEKVVPMAKIYVYMGWPIMGLVSIIYGIINFTNWGTTTAVIVIAIGIFLLCYGSWALLRSYKRLKK